MGVDNLSTLVGDRQDYAGQLFEGTVVNNQDPLHKGRFQVSVPGLFEEGELPWIGNVRESPFGMGDGFGTYGAPAVGSTVIIQLQHGDSKYGYKEGHVPKNGQIPVEFQSPNTWGYKDPSGNTLVVNMDAGTYTFTHSSGTTYTIGQDGSLDADIKSNVNINVNGNVNLNTTGDLNASVSGDSTIETSNATIDAQLTTITGETIIEGLLRVMAGMIIEGDTGSGYSAEMRGNVNHTDGVFRSNNVSISGHRHPENGSETSAPISGT